MANIIQRFPCTGMIASFDVFAGTGLHEEGHSAAYGEDDIQYLTAQFAPTVVNEDATLTEWRTRKEVMWKDNTVEGKSAQEVMHLLVSTLSHALLYPNLASLACAALVLPMSTVDCKRGFSACTREDQVETSKSPCADIVE